jgi:glycosyltransferase involved in cell wall biosynthesis
MRKLKVYVDATAWFIRPKNTDWLYMHSLRQMSDHVPLEFIYEFNAQEILAESLHYVSARFASRLLEGRKNQYLRRAKSRTVARGSADVVFSHSRFPLLDADIPVVWFYGVVDPRMQIARGARASDVEQQYSLQSAGFERAAKILQPTKEQVSRHTSRFPEIAEKFAYAPFFLPSLKAVPEISVRNKQAAGGKIRLLFVGREAKRKGLDILVDALAGLKKEEKNCFSLDVVSSMSDGAVDLTPVVDVTYHAELPRKAVFELMRNAHAFVMPSRFESYGLTFIEALASGCVVIGPDWDAQKEIVDSGRSGISTRPTSDELRNALRLLLDSGTRCDLALSGLDKFSHEYSAERVAKRHFEIMESAVFTRVQ